MNVELIKYILAKIKNAPSNETLVMLPDEVKELQDIIATLEANPFSSAIIKKLIIKET